MILPSTACASGSSALLVRKGVFSVRTSLVHQDSCPEETSPESQGRLGKCVALVTLLCNNLVWCRRDYFLKISYIVNGKADSIF